MLCDLKPSMSSAACWEVQRRRCLPAQAARVSATLTGGASSGELIAILLMATPVGTGLASMEHYAAKKQRLQEK